MALWDVESRDWTGEDPKALAERVLVWVRPGSVVLLHDNRRFPQTLAILDEILPRLKRLRLPDGAATSWGPALDLRG